MTAFVVVFAILVPLLLVLAFGVAWLAKGGDDALWVDESPDFMGTNDEKLKTQLGEWYLQGSDE